jgi:hypothetical protein
MTENNENKLYGYDYELPEDRDVFIDTESGKVVEKEELTPFQIIKSIAKENKYEINDPDPSCKKCYGRGYIGKDSNSKMPFPCKCIYPKRTPQQKEEDRMVDSKLNVKLSRSAKRHYKREMLKYIKKNKNKILNNLKNKDTSATTSADSEMEI